MEKLRIVFMGTPEFAVGILDTILKHNFNVVGVITAADKPVGRGQKIKHSAVKEFALKRDLKLLQPANLKEVSFLHELEALQANLQVVVAFRMLPQVVWAMPEYGTFNLHASLLPDYRGAAPINWAITNGESQTGVTTFFIDDKIDTGVMINSAEISISENENAEQLHDRLMHLGSTTVIETIKSIADGSVKTTIQKEKEQIKTAYKLDKNNCKIDWSQSGTSIHNLIRGLSPYPASWCFFKDGDQEWIVKIYEAFFTAEIHSEKFGKVNLTKRGMKVAVANGFIIILCLQFPGKKKMTTSNLLNGMVFSENAVVY